MAKKAASQRRRVNHEGRTSTAEPLDDVLEYLDNGGIRIVANDTEYRLRVPKLGELREFMTELDRVTARHGDQSLQLTFDDHAADVIGIWRLVVDMLDRKGQSLPASDDDCPVWMAAASSLPELKKHWLTVPLGRGGTPSQRATASAMDQLQQMGGLQALAPLLALAQSVGTPSPTSTESAETDPVPTSS